ncbi:serine hydrolase [Pseudoalteromonas piscicida]
MKALPHLLLFLCLFSMPAQATTQLQKQLDDYIAQYHQIKEFDGAALVARGSEVLLQQGYGFANVEWQIANQPNTKFKLASVTKQFTALLVLQQVEKGKIELDANISSYLPKYRKDTGDQITIRQLLNHTSGLPDVFQHPEFRQLQSHNPYNRDEFIDHFCSGDLLFEPGSAFRYSNAGYTILGRILELVSEKSYWQLLEKQILVPLDMKETGFADHKQVIKGLASGYDTTLKGVKHADFIDMTVPFSAGAMYSTVQDMYKWNRALYTDKLLTPETKTLLFTPSKHRNYGFGWEVSVKEDASQTKTLIHHAGGIPGFGAKIARVLEDKTVVILLDNTGGAPLTQMVDGILEILAGRAVAAPKLSPYRLLFATILSDGVEVAIKNYQQQVREGKGLSERQLNRFGYQLLEVGYYDAAIEFFKLNVTAHPKSVNTYDSLAEAYLIKGDTTNARVTYRQLLQLDSSHEAAKRFVESTLK